MRLAGRGRGVAGEFRESDAPADDPTDADAGAV